jgi:hypothetical protein
MKCQTAPHKGIANVRSGEDHIHQGEWDKLADVHEDESKAMHVRSSVSKVSKCEQGSEERETTGRRTGICADSDGAGTNTTIDFDVLLGEPGAEL